jgi:hypothetical protein
MAEDYVWIRSDPAVHFTSLVAGTAENESLEITGDPHRFGGHPDTSWRRFMIESFVIKILDDTGGTMDQDMTVYFYSDTNFLSATLEDDSLVGYLEITGSDIQDVGSGVFYWADTDIEQLYYDVSGGPTSPRLHVRIDPASGGDLAADDELLIEVGLRILHPS